ncbi:hypothetical protein ElyMa_005184300 [Elysia marginata]|uniref:Uncharacterized protein n=1 Tax=Elysia marginata TaxID=1093978 RepID=A0AAV4JTS5_9GAST|nr:hypothetical protein ElyMa_005184300 [Elysia marginata]
MLAMKCFAAKLDHVLLYESYGTHGLAHISLASLTFEAPSTVASLPVLYEGHSAQRTQLIFSCWLCCCINLIDLTQRCDELNLTGLAGWPGRLMLCESSQSHGWRWLKESWLPVELGPALR